MNIALDMPLTFIASATNASNAMRDFVSPAVTTLCVIASLTCVAFLIYGGIRYSSSAGNPESLHEAKKVIKNALIGLVLVLAAGTLTAILSGAYAGNTSTGTENFPTLQAIEPKDDGFNLFDVVINSIVSVLRNIVQSIGEPFVTALGYFTNSTPLMGSNSSVFNLWAAVVAIADVLFILVIALIGFQVMSAATLGFDEVELKQLLPQMVFAFLLINTSIYIIDGLISLSNGMVYAIQSAFASTSVWDVLAEITKKSSDMGLAGLLIMIAFLILSVMLLVYYILRLVGLYIGTILAPIVILLWLLPAFRDFAISALKTFLVAVFVLFVHVIILLLVASIFVGINAGGDAEQPNSLMALLVGLAAVVALMKAQGIMNQLVAAASGPRAARELGTHFMRGVSYMSKSTRNAKNFAKSTHTAGTRMNQYVQKRQEAKEAGLRVVVKPTPTNAKLLVTGETRKAEKVDTK